MFIPPHSHNIIYVPAVVNGNGHRQLAGGSHHTRWQIDVIRNFPDEVLSMAMVTGN